MTRKKISQSVVLLVLLITVLHFFSSAYNLYISLWWIDIPLHFLGGMFAAYFSVWLWFFWRGEKLPAGIFSLMVGGAVAIGLAWEIFEFSLRVTFSPEGYLLDTASDLLSDLAGAIFAYFIFKKSAGIVRK
jgi:hypothetical protein